VKAVIAFVKETGGLTYAEEKMHEFKNSALRLLGDYPESEYRNALELMVNYVVDRRK